MKKKDTSWGEASEWYSDYLETTPDSYQKRVILPNLLRILSPLPGKKILDLACGQGMFAREFAKGGAQVIGADISPELIEKARVLSQQNISFHVSPADKLTFAQEKSFDAVNITLALENIENMTGTFAEAARVLKPRGALVIVMMHPAFRVPKHSSWGWDEKNMQQYRRTDAYLSQERTELLVHPGRKNSPTTISHHRSLQDISKALFKAGFVIARLEEWISHRHSQKGPRQRAEDAARKEIPLFLMLEARCKPNS